MPEQNRVIALMDLDCFYVQVERQKNPKLMGKPLILCQHGSKTGLPLSISYEARKFGIKRNMNINESKKLCPELEIAFVPQMEGLDKGDLTCYKKASDSIFDVIFEFCSNIVVEKASVDEAFFDMTNEIEQIMADENFKELLENPDEKISQFLPSTYTICADKTADQENSEQVELMKAYIEKCKCNYEDMKLLAGAFFLEKLRKKIFEKTDFHCSAGIASNKMMAKLVASRHKPKAQAVLPLSECVQYLKQVEIQSVRWFGGKFGNAIVGKLNIKNVGQISDVPISTLKYEFPDDYLRIINLSKGICNEPVVQRFMPKSLSVAKILYNVEKEKIMEWTHGLLAELLRRLEEDQTKFSRTAHHIEFGLSFKNRNKLHRSFNISSYAYEPICKNVKKIIIAHYGTSDESKWVPGPSYISMNATKFGPLEKIMLMSDFMKRKSNSVNPEDVQVIYETTGQQNSIITTTNDQEALQSEKKDSDLPKAKTSKNKAAKGSKVKSSNQKPSKKVLLMSDFMKDKDIIVQQRPTTSKKLKQRSSNFSMDNFMKKKSDLPKTDDIMIIDESKGQRKTKSAAPKRKISSSSKKKTPAKKLRKKEEAKSTTEDMKQTMLNFNGHPALAQQRTIHANENNPIELSSDTDDNE